MSAMAAKWADDILSCLGHNHIESYHDRICDISKYCFIVQIVLIISFAIDLLVIYTNYSNTGNTLRHKVRYSQIQNSDSLMLACYQNQNQ